MAQVAHVDVGTTPVNLTTGLAAGCYLAQPRDQLEEVGVLYATGATAPSDLDDWFSARAGEFFTFTVTATDPVPTWCRAVLGSVAVALARR